MHEASGGPTVPQRGPFWLGRGEQTQETPVLSSSLLMLLSAEGRSLWEKAFM